MIGIAPELFLVQQLGTVMVTAGSVLKVYKHNKTVYPDWVAMKVQLPISD
jgi:hypothetical protein